MHDERPLIRIDHPDVRNAGRAVSVDLLVDLREGVIGGQDFDNDRWDAINQRRFLSLDGNDVRRDVHDVNADRQIGIAAETNSRLTAKHLTSRYGLLIEPVLQDGYDTRHDFAVEPVTNGHGLLPQFAVDQPALLAVLGKRQHLLGGHPARRRRRESSHGRRGDARAHNRLLAGLPLGYRHRSLNYNTPNVSNAVVAFMP